MNNYSDKKLTKTKAFNFDYWCRLAKDNPEAFEQARKLEIEKHISTLGNDETQERLHKLQWRVEMERKRSKNAMDAAIRIYDMMWESVGNNFEVVQDLVNHFKPDADLQVSKMRTQAKVIKFNREEHTGTEG